MGNNAAGSDDRPFADRDPAQDGGVAADRSALLDKRGNAGPIRFRLQLSGLRRCARVSVVDERHAVADEDLVFYGHPFTDERMAGYLDSLPDPGALLDLYEGPDPGLIADLTAIQVGEGINPDTAAQSHVGCDAHKIPCFHRSPPGSRRLKENAAPIQGFGLPRDRTCRCC